MMSKGQFYKQYALETLADKFVNMLSPIAAVLFLVRFCFY